MYTATIKVCNQESPNKDNQQITNINKEGESNKEENYSNTENTAIYSQILKQSQIDLNPEDVMVLKIFAQVKTNSNCLLYIVYYLRKL